MENNFCNDMIDYPIMKIQTVMDLEIPVFSLDTHNRTFSLLLYSQDNIKTYAYLIFKNSEIFFKNYWKSGPKSHWNYAGYPTSILETLSYISGWSKNISIYCIYFYITFWDSGMNTLVVSETMHSWKTCKTLCSKIFP